MESAKVLPNMEAAAKTSPHRPFSVKLWPPSQSTRLLLVERMTTNLCAPSLFSRKYGVLSREEAEEDAKKIENAAYIAADEHHAKEPDGDGSSAVHLYASRSSKLMLEVLKRGPLRVEDSEAPSNDNVLSEAPSNDNVLSRPSLFDISGGSRAFIDAEEAEELLKPLAEDGNQYKRICFSNRSFGVDAAEVAEPILVTLRNQLTDVDLSDFVAGRPETEALQVMKIFSNALEGCVLKSLNLSNNALGEKGVRAFGSLLKSQTDLEELYLMNDGISEDAAKAVWELLPPTNKLKVLQFHNNMTGDEGALAISEMVKCSVLLEDFRCSATRVGSDGGVALADALENCPNLKKLDIRDNMFGTEPAIALSKALSKYELLTEVYLSYLNLEDEGATAVANALKGSAPNLQIIEIAGNDITAKASPSLAECFAAKQKLTKLNVSENELKDEGTAIVADSLKEGLTYLAEVDFSSNQMRDAGAKKLAKVVASKPDLIVLNINGNYLSDEGIEEIKEILEANQKSLDVLGPLDENDPEGEEENSEAESAGSEEDELKLKLESLKVSEE